MFTYVQDGPHAASLFAVSVFFHWLGTGLCSLGWLGTSPRDPCAHLSVLRSQACAFLHAWHPYRAELLTGDNVWQAPALVTQQVRFPRRDKSLGPFKDTQKVTKMNSGAHLWSQHSEAEAGGSRVWGLSSLQSKFQDSQDHTEKQKQRNGKSNSHIKHIVCAENLHSGKRSSVVDTGEKCREAFFFSCVCWKIFCLTWWL